MGSDGNRKGKRVCNGDHHVYSIYKEWIRTKKKEREALTSTWFNSTCSQWNETGIGIGKVKTVQREEHRTAHEIYFGFGLFVGFIEEVSPIKL